MVADVLDINLYTSFVDNAYIHQQRQYLSTSNPFWVLQCNFNCILYELIST